MPELSGLVDRLEQAVAAGVFPGAVLQVQRAERVVHRSCHGQTSLQPPGAPIDEQTCFDLASLTKVLSTSSLVLLAIQRGELALDEPIARALPVPPGQGQADIRIEQLLDHSSGLAAWRPFYEELAGWAGGSLLATAKGRAAIREMVVAELPQAIAGQRVEYSDLGFILLDWILERTCGASADRLFADRVARPLGIDALFFIDLSDRQRADRARAGRIFAATERCPWRGRVLVGEVHDDNTWAMGGVSGHAGLFGTAGAVCRLAQAWLRAYQGHSELFDPDLVRRFWTRSRLPGSSRALGFDTPAAQLSQAGERMGPRTVGHLGFAGTSLWIDPDRGLIAVLLSNRVHPTRDNEGIKQFRPDLHDALVAAFDRECR